MRQQSVKQNSYVMARQEKYKQKFLLCPFVLFSLHCPCVSAWYIDQPSPISRNTYSAIKSSIRPASARHLLKDNICSWSCKWSHGTGLCKLSVYTFSVELCLKKFYRTALTSNGWNSSQSFLICSSWVIILNLAWIKISISFLDWLIFSSTLHFSSPPSSIQLLLRFYFFYLITL